MQSRMRKSFQDATLFVWLLEGQRDRPRESYKRRGRGGRRWHFDIAAICRKDGKKKFVELGMVRHDCGDCFGKCDFVSHFHDPFICAGPEGENVYQ